MGETWKDSQRLEAGFWGTCANTYGEETKQLLYMSRMGFKASHDGKSPFSFDGGGLSYLDIGGGPVSVLLKFRNAYKRVVLDPCQYPDWVYARYRADGIECIVLSAEDAIVPDESPPNRCCGTGPGMGLYMPRIDVALIYNVLQHVSDPQKVIENALRATRTLHMFEWVDMPAHPGHPHCLTQGKLEAWTGLKGAVEQFNGINECYGRAWYV